MYKLRASTILNSLTKASGTYVIISRYDFQSSEVLSMACFEYIPDLALLDTLRTYCERTLMLHSQLLQLRASTLTQTLQNGRHFNQTRASVMGAPLGCDGK